MSDMKYKYFSSIEGKVVPRYGSGAFIGCRNKVDPDTGTRSMVWDTEKVVAVLEADYTRYLKEYTRALDKKQVGGAALVKRSKKDFEAYTEQSEAPAKKETKKRQKKDGDKDGGE